MGTALTLTMRGLSRAPISSSTSAGGRDVLIRRNREKLSSSLKYSLTGRAGRAGVRQGASLPRQPPAAVLTRALILTVPEPAQGGQEPGEAAQEPLPVAAEQDLPGFGQETGEAATRDMGWAMRPRPSPALPRSSPQPCRSHGAIEVAHHARGLSRRGVPEAGVVHVADDALQPGQGPRRGQSLVGKVA